MASRLTSLAFLERLVAFDTTSRNSNLALIDFVRGYLADFGVSSRLTFDDEDRKANLYATLGPEDRPGLALSGHTDVVPVDGQDWHSDPFALVQREARLFGRGTADMKGFLAVVLALVPEFLNHKLVRPLHLCLSYDEEVGCIGVRRLIADLDNLPVRPLACVIGEPTGMRVINGQKGKRSMRCHVHGRECHSALNHTGVNAVEAAAEVVVMLRRLADRLRREGPFDSGFEPPYTTVHTGVIRGGTAINIVPKDCWFDFEFRALPGHDSGLLFEEVRRFAEEGLLPPMRAIAPESGFDWEVTSDFPGILTPEDAPITRLAQALSGDHGVGKVSYGTEGGLFEKAGIPTVICGPGHIDQAHKPDEFIDLAQLQACERFMRGLMEHLGREDGLALSAAG